MKRRAEEQTGDAGTENTQPAQCCRPHAWLHLTKILLPLWKAQDDGSPGRNSSSSSGSPVLSGRINQVDRADGSQSDPEMPDPAAPDGSLPQQLGNWHENQELQVGRFWTSSVWQMASPRAGPQPVISRGSSLPVFHIQFQPSAFNFAEDWRVFLFFFPFSL